MAESVRVNQRVSALYQAVAFIISFSVLFLILSIRYAMFIPKDPVQPLSPNSHGAQKVITGLHITHFTQFQVSHNKFELHGIAWFVFDPKVVTIEQIKQFQVFNGQVIRVFDPTISQYEKQTVAQFRVQISFYCPLNYRMFPFDDHHISIILTNNALPENVVLTSAKEDITINPELYLPGWQLIDHNVRYGSSKVQLQTGSQTAYDIQKEVVISFMAERNDPSIAINIILTLIILLFMSLLAFSSDEDSVLIVTVAMVALIGYRVVMQSLGPAHISYFMLSDYLYLFTLTGTIFTLFGGIITRERNSSKKTKMIYVAVIYALFVAGCSLMSFIL